MDLKIEDLNLYYFYDRHILHDINLTIKNNKVTTIVGASNSGKTALIMAIKAVYNNNLPENGIISSESDYIKYFESKYSVLKIIKQHPELSPVIIKGTINIPKEIKLLTFDEPNFEDEYEIMKLQKDHMIIVATQIPEQARRLGGDIIYLFDGCI